MPQVTQSWRDRFVFEHGRADHRSPIWATHSSSIHVSDLLSSNTWDCSVDIFHLRVFSKWKEEFKGNSSHNSKAYSLLHTYYPPLQKPNSVQPVHPERDVEGVGGWWWVGGSLRNSTPGSGLNGYETLGKVLDSVSLSFPVSKQGMGETYLPELVNGLRGIQWVKHSAQHLACHRAGTCQETWSCVDKEHRLGSSLLVSYFLSTTRENYLCIQRIYILASVIDHTLR